MSRTRLLLLYVIIAFGLLSAGRVAAAPVTVTFGTPLATWPEMQKAMAQFEHENPGIHVELQNISGNLGEGLLKLAAAGQMPDTFSVVHSILPGLLKYKLLTPLEPLFKSDNSVSEADYVALDMGPPGIWALPLTANVWFTIYNHSLMSKRGVDDPQPGWTPNDLRTLALKLTSDSNADGKLDTWGYGGYQMMFDPNAVETWLRPFGASLFDPAGRPVADSPEMTEALSFWSDLTAHGMTLVPSLQGSPDWMSGHVGMSLGDRVWLFQMAAQLQFDWALAPLPFADGVAPSTVGTGHYFGIASTSAHKQAAWKLITWLTGPAGHEALRDKGLLPGNIKAFSIFERFWDSKRSDWNVPDHFNVILDSTAFAQPPSIVASGLANNEVAPALRAKMQAVVLDRTVAPREGAEELQQKLIGLVADK